jgi:two-component system response regulator HydG
MVVVDYDGTLDVDDLPDDFVGNAPVAAAYVPSNPSAPNLIGRPLDEVERYYIAEALKLAGGNREEAAKMLGMGERTLYRKLKEFGIG